MRTDKQGGILWLLFAVPNSFQVVETVGQCHNIVSEVVWKAFGTLLLVQTPFPVHTSRQTTRVAVEVAVQAKRY